MKDSVTRNRESYERNRDRVLERSRRKYANNREKRLYQMKILPNRNKNARKHHALWRKVIILAYGGKCACCGEREYDFLTIDHVNNDGSVDRAMGLRGSGLYKKIMDRGFPPDYRVLCWNCNCSRAYKGKCPHELTLNSLNTLEPEIPER